VTLLRPIQIQQAPFVICFQIAADTGSDPDWIRKRWDVTGGSIRSCRSPITWFDKPRVNYQMGSKNSR